VIELTIKKGNDGMKVIKCEIEEKLTHAPYPYDKELKYLVYRILLEINQVI
jgi:hypothetical protein